ncbi:glycosyltransferase family 4 protein [Paenibacillus xylanexedens]|uniref:glycosyltransferase family 4 protein n=1 Tax=Paenibacillus xylanexedens TaxID=528191 RepID=UPI000F5296C4|nr:glycosyltransferase family 4 protein [Paenibacillus xylanexedens]RPK20003.1 hypothetical protein EDO6_06520 [Paenibacillus xylanexedens]
MNNDYQVVWRGYVGGSTGYDRASREYLLAIDRLGVDVKIEPMAQGSTIFTAEISQEQISRLKELINKPYAQDKKKVLIYHAQPNGVKPLVEKNTFDKVIILTVWETTKIPSNWLESSNEADAVIIPTTQNKDALSDSGVISPIYVVPHGADVNTYSPDNTVLPLANVQNSFNFLSVFQWQHRKAPEILLRAFWEEFTDKDNVSLVLKTYWGHNVSKEESRIIIKQIAGYKEHLGFSNTAPVYVSTSMFDDDDLKGLYVLGDVFVLPTRGEGVGLPYIESLSSGVPVIATAWGGSMDFLTNENSFLVDYDLVSTDYGVEKGISPHFNNLFTPDMKWAEPNLESLKKEMRKAYENPQLVEAKGKAGRQQMEQMTWDKSGEILKEVIEEVCKQ